MRSKFYISIGSNEGDRLLNVIRSVRLLKERFSILGFSSIYLTKPVGFIGRDFLNCCALLKTEHNPFETLRILQYIERALGRTHKGKPYKDRTIDLDILLWENLTVKSQELTIPHPEMKNRDFVNIPLKEMFSLGFSDMGYTPVINGDQSVEMVIYREALRFD
ncbi:MAG: 2-amino-4-hydroxy-6-hydroxymethyldihydropteridine diphosphokinase [candidate division WOR-3 bacterium]